MKRTATARKRGLARQGSKVRLLLSQRPQAGLGEWLAALVRGLDALEFLERSRDLAAEAVTASPVSLSARSISSGGSSGR
jgi:hypothetical protein